MATVNSRTSSGALARPHSVVGAVRPYVQIARVDHWFKNAFMALGVLLALFYEPQLFATQSVGVLALAGLATCLIASSNYVLNEILDGPTDRLHPQKRHRPVPAGLVSLPIAYAEWLLLATLGLSLAIRVNPYFALSAFSLWVMGLLYNVPPFRTKEWPYVDVLSESVNKATKRYAEYRHIGDKGVAAGYRKSFNYYTEERLLISMFFYATTCTLFAGVFIVRYHLELILFAPFAAGVFAYYLKIGMQRDSPVQNPEKLYKERGFFAFMVLATVLFVVLMFTRIPTMYDWFNVEQARTSPLWTLGQPPR